MSDHTWLFVAVCGYFAVLLYIGYRAFRKTRGHEGYMLADRGLPPWVAALSAGASDMSGWLIMGLPGAVYLAGLIEAWIAIGLTIGAYLNWLIVAPRLRMYTEVSRNSITIPSFFENRLRDETHVLRTVSSVIIIVFFTLYISSGMVAGGVFFESAFGGEYLTGMLLVTAVTLAYTLFGGFLGASLTDVLQGLMLVVAIVLLPVIATVSVGGVGEAIALIGSLSPAHFDLLGGTGLTSATIIGIASGLAWGLGYFGQPHIIVRFMALRSSRDARSARKLALGWQALSLAGAVCAGLIGVAFVADRQLDLSNPETVVLLMGKILLHPLLAGLVLAAVLAAIMSTFSSQLIVCSSALVEDLYRVTRKTRPSDRTLVMLGRGAVLLVALVAALLAIRPNDSILGLVSFAWAGFGAAFGPIVLLSLYWRRLTNWGAIAAMLVGAVTVFAWSGASGGLFDLYELLPGFVAATVTAVLVSLLTARPNPEIDAEFMEVTERLGAAAPKTRPQS